MVIAENSPTIGVEARIRLVRALPDDPNWGRRIDGGKETGNGGCGESAGRRGEATVAGFARDRGEAPDPTKPMPPAEARSPAGHHHAFRMSHPGSFIDNWEWTGFSTDF